MNIGLKREGYKLKELNDLICANNDGTFEGETIGVPIEPTEK